MGEPQESFNTTSSLFSFFVARVWISGGGKKQQQEEEALTATTVLLKLMLSILFQHHFLLKSSLNRRFKDGFHKTVFEKLGLFIKKPQHFLTHHFCSSVIPV